MKINGYTIEPMADLSGADLTGADLTGANLSWADLSRADLSRADLSWADLFGADLRRANLSGTCLDPENLPNADCELFARDTTGMVIGYRTRITPHIHTYRDGQTYGADFFSTCQTECHPGLYLWPTLEMVKNWMHASEIIRVTTEAKDIHRAGGNWRARWFRVIGTA